MLFHQGFDLRAFFRTHVLHAFARVRHFLPVDFAFAVDLPQSRFDRRCGLRLRGKCRGSNCEGGYQRTESGAMHESFLARVNGTPGRNGECFCLKVRNVNQQMNSTSTRLQIHRKRMFCVGEFLNAPARSVLHRDVECVKSNAGSASPAIMTAMSGLPAVYSSESMRAEKRAVAGNSVLAAIAITTLKIVVGVTTGSLGILSEALHSALDLVAAIITLMSVRVSDKPADADHQYGHGKVENFSAFIETG